jgi:hypothetical protein
MIESFHSFQMKKIKVHFNRTILLASFVQKQVAESVLLQELTSIDNSKDLFKYLFKVIDVSNVKYSERLKEIYSIEKEKFSLRDSKEITKEIFKNEAFLNIQREKLLSSSYLELKRKTFIMNSKIYLYESDWNWIVRDPIRGRNSDINKILKSKKDDHYFLFEKTGTYDIKLDSNISEFPLSKYQYFLLSLFEKSGNLNNVINMFIQSFEINNIEEKKELLAITEVMIRELIFRRFIVIPNTIEL